jgi:hypothetical protein
MWNWFEYDKTSKSRNKCDSPCPSGSQQMLTSSSKQADSLDGFMEVLPYLD